MYELVTFRVANHPTGSPYCNSTSNEDLRDGGRSRKGPPCSFPTQLLSNVRHAPVTRLLSCLRCHSVNDEQFEFSRQIDRFSLSLAIVPFPTNEIAKGKGDFNPCRIETNFSELIRFVQLSIVAKSRPKVLIRKGKCTVSRRNCQTRFGIPLRKSSSLAKVQRFFSMSKIHREDSRRFILPFQRARLSDWLSLYSVNSENQLPTFETRPFLN